MLKEKWVNEGNNFLLKIHQLSNMQYLGTNDEFYHI